MDSPAVAQKMHFLSVSQVIPIVPAPTDAADAPQRVVKAYIMHRQWREQTILTCLEEGVSTIPRIVSKIYGALDADLRSAAALSVLAHLEHMINRGLATAADQTVHDAAAAEPQEAGSVSGLSRVYSAYPGASSPAS